MHATLKGQKRFPRHCESGRLIELSSPLTPSAFVERLLEAEEPVWCRWDRDLPALLSELIAVAHRDWKIPALDPSLRGRWQERKRWRRLFWLLDRLTPLSQAEVFEPFRDRGRALFAWGRRLSPDRRHLIIATARDADWRDACMQAWCASCRDEALPALLDWTEAWKSVPKVIHHMGRFPEEEFHDRATDETVRYQLLCEHLAKACARFRGGDESARSLARPVIHRVLRMTLRHAATLTPGPDGDAYQSQEHWQAWLERILATPAFAQVAEASGEFLRWWYAPCLPNVGQYNALWVWAHMHRKGDWETLVQSASYHDERFIYDRLAEIMPFDALSAWRRMIQHQSQDRGQMQAFCRWLPVAYTQVLQSHFSHPDAEWAACAYQCHLAKSPWPVLSWEWQRREALPSWQTRLLDRRLFAPEALLPHPFVEDIQDAENDFRLEEPFSRRGI